MSDRPSIDNVERIINDDIPIDDAAPQSEAVYQIDPNSKVPVSKHHGKRFKSMLSAAQNARTTHVLAWDESIRYYNNDQMSHRVSDDNRSGNRYFSKRRNNQWSETENIVYSNTAAMMPAVYAKNPTAEFTPPVAMQPADEARMKFLQALEMLVNTLAAISDAPGLNAKVHATQAIISAELTNLGWIEVGWVDRAQSSFGVQDELKKLSDELAKAADVKTIREIEGKLMALEEATDVLTPPGPYWKYHSGHTIVPDAGCRLPDFSDARTLFIEEYYPTAYLNARYGKKDSAGVVKSLYDPTHVLCAGDGTEDDINNFKLFKSGTTDSPQSYGYESQEDLKRMQMTKCWRVLDKTTRRVYLYADNQWTYPIWVENDPYGLPGFFNFVPLYFNITPLGAYARSSTTYYLDQQDALNEIHDEFRRARQDVKENVLYDSKFDRATVTAWLTGSSPNAQGVDVPDGRTLKDMIFTKPNVMLQSLPLFDVQRVMQSADRISGVSDVLRGAQFKTNTTNKAIENYNSSTAMRIDAKIDRIEDFLGKLFYITGFLCAQYMTQEEVASYIGEERAAVWKNYSASELRNMFRCRVVGGSTQKPTTSAKKQQSLELARILSNLAQFAPTVVLETTLTLFDEAFDEVQLPNDAFKRIAEEAAVAMQRGKSTGGAGGDGGPSLDDVAQAVDQLPPQAKLALGEAIAKGVPVTEALQEVLSAMRNSTTPTQGQ